MNKQIDEMAQLICKSKNPELGKDCSKCVFNCMCDIQDGCEVLIEYDYRKSEWISVDERLPESGVRCLLCCDVKRYDGTHRQYVCDGYYAERWKEECHFADDECVVEYNEETDEYYLHEGWYECINNWDDYCSIVINDTVTHWMPLPEAPKKYESEGEDDELDKC